MKTCTKCKVEKDEALFNKDASRKYGLSFRCRKCDNERNAKYYLENKDKVRKQIAKWRAENKDKIKEWDAKWRAENKDYCYKYHAKRIENLADGYVAVGIIQGTTLKAKDIPIELIEAKRMQIMINRKLKEMR